MAANWIRKIISRQPAKTTNRLPQAYRRALRIEQMEDRVVPSQFAPAISFSNAPETTNEGTTITRFGAVNDADPEIQSGTLSVNVGTLSIGNPGDPGFVSGSTIGFTDAANFTFTYTPPDGPSITTVTVTATDPDGSTQASFPLTVNNVTPDIDGAPSPQQALAGKPMTFTLGTIDDPAGVNDEFTGANTGYKVDINWGDGSPVQTIYRPEGVTIAATHTYAAPGSYPVTVTATDADNATDATPETFTVNVTNFAGSGAGSMTFVDDNFTEVQNVGGGTPGGAPEPGDIVIADTDPGTAGNQPAVFGFNAFPTINQGIQATDAGGTVTVFAGTYNENVLIDRGLTLKGPQFGVNPTPAGTRTTPANEAVINGQGGGDAVQINPTNTATGIAAGSTKNVIVDGFTVDGNGATAAITNFIGAGTANYNNTQVRNNIVTDAVQGIELFGFQGAPATTISTGNAVTNNRISGLTAGAPIGIVVAKNLYGSVTGNTIDGADTGILVTGYSSSVGSGNTSDTLTLDSNTITGAGKAVSDGGIAVGPFTIGAIDAAFNITNNTISAVGTGVDVVNTTMSNVIAISGGNITNSTTGIRFGDGVDATKGSITAVNFNGGTDNTTDVLINNNPATTPLTAPGTDNTVAFGPDNVFSADTFYINNQDEQNIDLTGYTLANFPESTSFFDVEDKIFHKVDDPSKGLVRFNGNNIFVTPTGTDSSIQQGIDAAPTGGTVFVQAGTYELTTGLVIDDDITLSGAQAGNDARNFGVGTPRATETIIRPAASVVDIVATDPVSAISTNALIYVTATGDGATIDGFTLEGAGGNAGGQLLLDGTTVSNAARGINIDGDNVSVLNNRLLDFYRRGAQYGANFEVTGGLASQNRADVIGRNVPAGDEGVGLLAFASPSMTNNKVTNAHVGLTYIQVYASVPANTVTINVTGNDLSARSVGLSVNETGGFTGPINVTGNTITTAAGGTGALLWTIGTGATFTFNNNTLTGSGAGSTGVYAWTGAQAMTITLGGTGTTSITGYDTGVLVNNENTFGVSPNPTTVTLDNVTITSPALTTATGVGVVDTVAGTSAVTVNLTNGTTVIGNATADGNGTSDGVRIEGALATANLTSSKIYGHEKGVWVGAGNPGNQGGTVSLNNVDFDETPRNKTDLLVSPNATAVTFSDAAGDTQFAGTQYYVRNESNLDLDLRGKATFTETSPFRVEDRMFGAVDGGGSGLVLFANEIYVTSPQNNTTNGTDADNVIQNGVAASNRAFNNPDLNTPPGAGGSKLVLNVRVEAGTYNQDVDMTQGPTGATPGAGFDLIGDGGKANTIINGVAAVPTNTVTVGAGQTLTGFTVNGNGANGFAVLVSGGGALVEANNITGGAGGGGLALATSGLSASTVNNNDISNNSGQGIQLNPNVSATITNNTVSNNTANGVIRFGGGGSVTLTGNTILNNGDAGISFGTDLATFTGTSLIQANTIGGNATGGIVFENNFGAGVDVLSDVDVVNNLINGGTAKAIQFAANVTAVRTGFRINENQLIGGIENLSATAGAADADPNTSNPIDAEYNYFGSADPTPATAIVSGPGAGNVDVNPFLTNPDADGATAGFQGDFTDLGVTTAGGGQTDRINEAVDSDLSAPAGGDADTVFVQGGTYNEDVDLDRTVRLEILGDVIVNGSLSGVAGSVIDVNNVATNKFTFGDADNTTFNGTFVGDAGDQSIVKTGTGTTILTGNSSGLGTGAEFEVNRGTLQLDGTLGGPVRVDSTAGTATLSGTGTVVGRIIVASNGIVSPGSPANTVGTLTTQGNSIGFLMRPNSTLAIDLSGTTSDTLNAALVNLNGTPGTPAAPLDNTVLQLTTIGAAGPNGAVYTIINNTGGSPVTGTFVLPGNTNELTQGESFTVGGQTFSIFYNGGDGNDVVLVRTNGGTGGLPGGPPFGTVFVDDSFSTTPGTTITDADPSTPGNQGAVVGTSAFGSINAGLAAMGDGGTLNVAAGTYNEDVNFDVAGPLGETLRLTSGPVEINGFLDVPNPLSKVDLNGFQLTAGDGATGDLSSDIAGTIIGGGTNSKLILDGDTTLSNSGNTFGGTLTVTGTGNTLTLLNSEVIPDTAEVILGDGATLDVNAKLETIRALSTPAGATVNSATTNLNGGTLTVNGPVSRTYAGTITGAGNFVKDGAGTMTLTGSSTAFTGTATVLAGILRFNQGAALRNGAVGTPVVTDSGFVEIANTAATTQSAVVGAISGGGGLIKSGAGDLTVDVLNTYTAANTPDGVGTIVNGGRLLVPADANLGAATANVAVNGSGRVVYTAAADSTGRDFQLNTAAATLEVDGPAADTLTLTGTASVTGGQLAGVGRFVSIGAQFNGVNTLSTTRLDAGAGTTLNSFTNNGILTTLAGVVSSVGLTNTSAGRIFVNGTLNADSLVSNGIIDVAGGGTLERTGGDLVLGGGSDTIIRAGGTLGVGNGAAIPGNVLVNGGRLRNFGHFTGATVFDANFNPISGAVFINFGSVFENNGTSDVAIVTNNG